MQKYKEHEKQDTPRPKVTDPTFTPNETNLYETLDKEFKITVTNMFREFREETNKFLNEFCNTKNQLNKIKRSIWGMKT